MRAVCLLALVAASATAQPRPLDRVADALGGADRFDALTAVRLTSRAVLTLDGQTVRTRTRVTLALPAVARIDVTLDGAERRVILDEEAAVSVVGAEVRQIPEAHLPQTWNAVWHLPVALLARRAEVAAEVLTPSLLRVLPPGAEPFLLRLDEDGRPDLLTQETADGRYVAVQFSDYREVGGLSLPHRTEQAVDGIVTGVVTLARVDLDPVLGDDTFAVPRPAADERVAD